MTPNGEIVINLPAEIQTRPGFPNNLPRDAISAFDSRADDGAAGASDARSCRRYGRLERMLPRFCIPGLQEQNYKDSLYATVDRIVKE